MRFTVLREPYRQGKGVRGAIYAKLQVSRGEGGGNTGKVWKEKDQMRLMGLLKGRARSLP